MKFKEKVAEGFKRLRMNKKGQLIGALSNNIREYGILAMFVALVLIVLSQFQLIPGNTTAAYSAIGSFITGITDNIPLMIIILVVVIAVIIFAAFGGFGSIGGRGRR